MNSYAGPQLRTLTPASLGKPSLTATILLEFSLTLNSYNVHSVIQQTLINIVHIHGAIVPDVGGSRNKQEAVLQSVGEMDVFSSNCHPNVTVKIILGELTTVAGTIPEEAEVNSSTWQGNSGKKGFKRMVAFGLGLADIVGYKQFPQGLSKCCWYLSFISFATSKCETPSRTMS